MQNFILFTLKLCFGKFPNVKSVQNEKKIFKMYLFLYGIIINILFITREEVTILAFFFSLSDFHPNCHKCAGFLIVVQKHYVLEECLEVLDNQE